MDTPLDPADTPATSGLVRRAQTGDRTAFDALIRRCQDRLLRLVRTRLGPELRHVEESGDVLQSVLADAVRDLERFEYRGEGSFLRWLGALVEHKLRHHARDAGRAKRDREREVAFEGAALAAPEPRPSQVAAGRELQERYRLALERLDDADREVVLLHLELGCTHDEIAAALSIPSAEAVRKRIARALVRLEGLLGEKPR